MNQFVEDCRSEWKRLGVPEPVADEMAAELAADLAEAEAEGVSAQDVLGAGVLDPREFARAWAVERGVVKPPATATLSRTRRILVAAATGLFALVAVAGAAVLIADSPSTTPAKLAIASPVEPGEAGMVLLRAPVVSPDGRTIVVPARDMHVVGPLPVERMPAFSVDVDESGFDERILGPILLSVGLTGLVLLLVLGVAWPQAVAPRRA